MKHFNTIIIGAGPAGLSCAKELGKTQKTLIIDKEEILGNKVCAGGLTILNHNLNLSHNLPHDKYLSFKEQYFTINNFNKKIVLEHPIITIDRQELARYQLNQIVSMQNITILTNTILNYISKNFIMTNKGKFYFDSLVGADGSNSQVRKYLKLKNRFYIGLSYRLKNCPYDKMRWIFNTKILKSGYAWIFPHINYVSVGCDFNPLIVNTQVAKKYLHEIIKKFNFSISSEQLESAPINTLYQGTKFTNIYLIGDAAGLPCAFTGEGISFAMISGQEIAKLIVDKNYETPQLKKILSIKKRREKSLKFFDILSNHTIQSILLNLGATLLKSKKAQKFFVGY